MPTKAEALKVCGGQPFDDNNGCLGLYYKGHLVAKDHRQNGAVVSHNFISNSCQKC